MLLISNFVQLFYKSFTNFSILSYVLNVQTGLIYSRSDLRKASLQAGLKLVFRSF
jgi:hypothetical protein